MYRYAIKDLVVWKNSKNHMPLIIQGARQVGKSTLFNMVLEGRKEPVLRLNCDEPEVQEMLTAMNTQELKLLIGQNKILVIDEAQRVENIGMTLKRIISLKCSCW